MPFNLGFGELLVVLIVALLVFGGRLPQMGKALGQGMRQFKKGLSGTEEEEEQEAGPKAELPEGEGVPRLEGPGEEDERGTEPSEASTPSPSP